MDFHDLKEEPHSPHWPASPHPALEYLWETEERTDIRNNIKQTLNVSQFSVAKSETLTLIISGQNINVNVSMSIKIHPRPKKHELNKTAVKLLIRLQAYISHIVVSCF